MFEFVAKLRGREGIFFLRRQCVQEVFDVRLMQKPSALVRRKELVEIEGIIDALVLFGQNKPLFDLAADHRGKLIGEHGKTGQRLIGVIIIAVPILFCFLFIGIRPVEDLFFGKLCACQLFERRSRKVERMLAGDVVERAVGTDSIHALLRLIHDEKVELEVLDPSQFIVLSTEIDGTFQPLQRFKGDHAALFAFFL